MAQRKEMKEDYWPIKNKMANGFSCSRFEFL